jgi:hypothetical protein
MSFISDELLAVLRAHDVLNKAMGDLFTEEMEALTDALDVLQDTLTPDRFNPLAPVIDDYLDALGVGYATYVPDPLLRALRDAVYEG